MRVGFDGQVLGGKKHTYSSAMIAVMGDCRDLALVDMRALGVSKSENPIWDVTVDLVKGPERWFAKRVS